MGKLGDLWVRLGLKSDDYKKGLDKAKKETARFSDKMEDYKKSFSAIWAAIGVAVIKMSKDIISATNKMGDAGAKAVGALKAAYHAFLADITRDKGSMHGFFASLSMNPLLMLLQGKNVGKFWKGTLGNAKEAGKAAKEMTAAFDAEFELVNSVKLQREMIKGELNQLYVQMRDTTLDPASRKAAQERYRALLQPIADAEIAVYTSMMEEASKAWQAGTHGMLSREYSTAEMTEFFANYGTSPEAMRAKYPELYLTYETRKGDAQNSVIFDTATKLAAATNEMSVVEKEMGEVTRSIVGQVNAQKKAFADLAMTLERDLDEVLTEDIENTVEAIEDAINGMELEVPEINTTALDASIKKVLAAADFYAQQLDIAKMKNEALEDAILSSLQGSMQGFTDMIFGLEGANMNNVLAALLSPFADLATRLGVIILTTGKGIEAFKVSLKSLQPGVALAAGAGLIALGAAMKSGIQALANQGGNTGGSAMSYGSSSSGGAAALNYESTLTVEVTGRISGNDIVLSGKKTNDKNSR